VLSTDCRLYLPNEGKRVYPYQDTYRKYLSQVDVEKFIFSEKEKEEEVKKEEEKKEREKFPLFASADYLECLLREGECLYIPPQYWAFSRNNSYACSVEFELNNPGPTKGNDSKEKEKERRKAS